MPNPNPASQLTPQKTPEEIGKDLAEIVLGAKQRLVSAGVPEDKALEVARGLLIAGTCSDGQQCAAAT